MNLNTLHPFPARMAPEIAITHLQKLPTDAVVLDPMAGSGTVLWQAASAGYRAIGFDLDPLAVLISRVRTTTVRSELITDLARSVVSNAKSLSLKKACLPWLDDDSETLEFIDYWFGPKQAKQLRLLAHVLFNLRGDRRLTGELNALRLSMSRLIVRKKNGASLAWDISHSRPHRVMDTNDFDVFDEFLSSARRIAAQLNSARLLGRANVYLGDARRIDRVDSDSIDAVITSPPYFNAIDYLRGHKLSLIWLGYSISRLRKIRSKSIGAERQLENGNHDVIPSVFKAFGNLTSLPSRQTGMLERYAVDIYSFIKEVSRVLKPKGKAVFVVGNSCVKDVFIKNSDAVVAAAKLIRLKVVTKQERDLPTTSRYLPVNVDASNALGRRMKTETVMTFLKL